MVSRMKNLATTLLLLTALVNAKTNPADFTLTAHVVSSIAGRGHGGSLTARTCTYELRIDQLTYIAQQRTLQCDAAVTPRAELPAQIEKSKLKVMKSDGKVLNLEIIGRTE